MFMVVAGKYESEGNQTVENTKYCDEFHTLSQALKAVRDRGLISYHFCWIEVDGYRISPSDIRRG